MAQNAWAGRRCQAVRSIVTPQGCIPQQSYGTLCRVVNHEGQFAVIVAWDTAFTAAVPPHDIRIFPSYEGTQAFPHALPLPLQYERGIWPAR